MTFSDWLHLTILRRGNFSSQVFRVFCQDNFFAGDNNGFNPQDQQDRSGYDASPQGPQVRFHQLYFSQNLGRCNIICYKNNPNNDPNEWRIAIPHSS